MYDYGARRYDPALARWISPDSIIPEPGNPQNLNRYTYTLGNPLRYTDPTGHVIVDTIVLIALGGAAVGAAIGYGTQVYDNMQEGMSFGDALTTDIEPTPILQGLFLGGAVATAGAAIATALGIGAGAGAVASSTATAACADGDCGNEFTTMLNFADDVAEELPSLEGTYADAFDGTIQQVTLEAGSRLPRVGPPGGNWFGLQIPQSAAEAEELYNVAAWHNTLDGVRMYEVTQDVTGYMGRVAGGTGNQFFVPYSVKVDEFMRPVAERIFE